MRKEVVNRWGGFWIVCGLLLQLTASSSAEAQVIAKPVTLGWNAATDISVRGYAIYYGRTSQPTNTRIDAGSQLNCTISGLTVGVAYRIYAVSYDAQGVESIPSNQLTFTPTTPAPLLQIARLVNGNMRLNYAAGLNTTCAVQFASSPATTYWQTLTNIAADASGNILVTDTTASRVPQRYYRIAHTPQPLTSPVSTTLQLNGSMRLNWTTPPAATSRIQYAASPNATTWTTFTTVTSNDEGQATYLDVTAGSAGIRFYRAVTP